MWTDSQKMEKETAPLLPAKKPGERMLVAADRSTGPHQTFPDREHQGGLIL